MTEREAIVAWLRKAENDLTAIADTALVSFATYWRFSGAAKAARDFADAIEAGQHLENKDG